MQTDARDDQPTAAEGSGPRLGRRRLVACLVAAPTLTVATRLVGDVALPPPAAAIGGLVVPTPDAPGDIVDLADSQLLACAPTMHLIQLTLDTGGVAHFALHRSENGQGITTSTAMLIADELDMPICDVKVTLADARPELLMNQLTGGSNSTMSTYKPIRTMAAGARQRLVQTAAKRTGYPAATLRTADGHVMLPDGEKIAYGDLAKDAAVEQATILDAPLKPLSALALVGKPQRRTDARASVTGTKEFTMDMDVPGALPTMVCRAPKLNGRPLRVLNLAEVTAMPGVTHVAKVSTGIAVRAATFGQCIDAVRAVRADWTEGSVGRMSDADVLAEVRKAEIPLLAPQVPLLAKTVDTDFTFWFASNSALETNCAIADVRSDRAEIWSGLQAPIVARREIAAKIGLPDDAVTVHVTLGGGSFGRKAFSDAAIEAAEVSQQMGVPVKLMWHRADDARVGRVHPMATSRIRATVLDGSVLTWEQRHTGVRTDFTHGFGDIITATAASPPVGDYAFSESIYALTQATHYNFGATTNLISETQRGFNTGAMRNIYSPNVATAREVTVDQLAKVAGSDPYQFRRSFLRKRRARAVLDKVAQVGRWGRSMPSGTAQGIAVHEEYHGFSACLVEIDCRLETVNRVVRDAVTGPRVTKVVFAVDVGLIVNPQGLEAQMMGGIMDGMAMTLTSSMHLQDGHFLEASWDNYGYTRQWHTPPELEIILVPSNGEEPGGAGEFPVASSSAAVATAFARATRTLPREFPINHADPLFFAPKSFVPPIPAAPTDGLAYTY
jgi:isoquinoline 1-oxidoreductase beta subunit